MTSSNAKKPNGYNDGKIEIKCTSKQMRKIKSDGCIAYTESCDAEYCDECAYCPNNIKFVIREEKTVERVNVKRVQKDNTSKIHLYTMKNYLRQWSISGNDTLRKNKRIRVCGIPMKANMLNRWYHIYEPVNYLRRSVDNNFNYYTDMIINHKLHSSSEVFRAAAELAGIVYLSANTNLVDLHKSSLMKYLSELNISIKASDSKMDLGNKVHNINECDLIEYIPKKSHTNIGSWVKDEKITLNNIKNDMSIYLSWLFNNMYLEVVQIVSDKNLITGDNPVIVDEDTILFTFSPKLLLVFRGCEKSNSGKVIYRSEYRPHYVDDINLRIEDNCKKYTVEK